MLTVFAITTKHRTYSYTYVALKRAVGLECRVRNAYSLYPPKCWERWSLLTEACSAPRHYQRPVASLHYRPTEEPQRLDIREHRPNTVCPLVHQTPLEAIWEYREFKYGFGISVKFHVFVHNLINRYFSCNCRTIGSSGCGLL
uniref:Ig-like domain-containing protein n=1 Tax=Heterorhabditis bacteriophora TaxID=37862 RepID=A0A1I7WAU3_HETBA